MSESIECPYCSGQFGISTHDDDATKQYVRCSHCGGIFEFLPGFGTFSLPERGAEYSREIRSVSRMYPSEIQSIDQSTTQSSSGCGGCCIVLIILLTFFLTGFEFLFFP
ncbi:MAG: MJ0042-type zinc finger domain-containing protein [Candidatus Thorarchaeota archaeon]